MTKQVFNVVYTFTSQKADGNEYKRTVPIKAEHARAALVIARTVGFSEFGARFTDNCINWEIAQ